MRAGCTSREESTDGGHRRAWLRTRRLSTPRAHGGGGRPAVWMASAAVQPRSRASSALDGASLLAQLRRPNATAAQRTAPNLWPTLSALFPLPSSRDLPLASRTALNQLAAQLDRLEAGGGGNGVHRVQLLLLGHRRLCDESDDVISLLYNHPNAIHLALETAVDATSSPSSTAAGTDRLARLAPFTADVMLAWAMLSPSGVRLYADGSSRLPDGALRARLDLLRRHASCDAMFVPAGATLGRGEPHVPSSRSRSAGGAYDAVAVRSWQLFDEPRPAGAAPPGGGTRSTSSMLEHAAVAQARVPRGAWPLWQSTSLPEGCRVGTSATTEAAAAAAAADEHDAAAAAAAAAAEVDYWLGCLQAGAVLCLAAPSPTPPPPRSHVASSAEDEEDDSVTAVTPGGIDTAPTERHAVAAASTISDVDGSGSDGWVEEAAGVVEGEALQMILRRRNRLAALRVLVVANSLPKHSLSDGGGDVRDYQLVNELAAEGHSVTVVHSQPSRSADVAALRDAGWRAFCPACLLPTAARCPECEDVQSATFVRCRLQAAARAPSRVAIIRAEDERELSAEAFDLVVILVAPDGASCNGTSGMAERILSSVLSEKPSATRPRLLALTDGLPQLAPAAAAAAGGDASAGGVSDSGAPAAPLFYTGANGHNCSSFPSTTTNAPAAAAVRAQRLGFHARVDLTLALTDEDRGAFRRARPTLPMRTLPFALPPPRAASLAKGFDERLPLVIFVSAYAPLQRRIVRWLVRQVWPSVIAVAPEATFKLAGAPQWKAEARAARANGIDGVGTLDAATSSSPSMLLPATLRAARVIVSPALASSGSLPAFGTLLAMSHGVPLVTTPIGARGLLASRTPGAVTIAKTSAEFALGIVRLLRNASVWTRAKEVAGRHVAKHLSEEAQLRELRLALAGMF